MFGHRRASSREEKPEQEHHEDLEDYQRTFLNQIILDARPREVQVVAFAHGLFVQAFASLPDRRFLLLEDAVGLGTLSDTNLLLRYAKPVANLQGPRLDRKHFAGLGLEHFPAFAQPLQDRRGAIQHLLGNGASAPSFQRSGPELDVFVVLSRQRFELGPIGAELRDLPTGSRVEELQLIQEVVELGAHHPSCLERMEALG